MPVRVDKARHKEFSGTVYNSGSGGRFRRQGLCRNLVDEIVFNQDVAFDGFGVFPVEYFRIFYYYFRVQMIVFLMFLGCPVFGAVAMRVQS